MSEGSAEPRDSDKNSTASTMSARDHMEMQKELETMLEDKLNATDWEATNDDIAEQVARESYIQYFRETEKRLKDQGHSLASGSSSTITSTMVSSPRTSRRGSVSPKGGQSPKASSPNLTPLASPRNSFGSSPESEHVVPNVPKPEESFAKLHTPRRMTAGDMPQESFTKASICKTTMTKSPRQDEAGPSSSSWHSIGSEFEQSGMSQSSFDDSLEDEVLMHVIAQSQQSYLEELKKKGKRNGNGNGSPGPSTSH